MFTIGIFWLSGTTVNALPLGPIVPDSFDSVRLLGPTSSHRRRCCGSFLGYSVDIISPAPKVNAAMSLVLPLPFGSRSIWLHHPIVS
jgi:hypothetical protein